MPREHPLSWHRLVPLAAVVLLAAVAAAALRGPVWYRRLYYPLEYRDLIAQSAKQYRMDPYFLTAVVHSESDFDPRTVSKAGAVGLMQVMPDTANETLGLTGKDRLDAQDLMDPATNIGVGTRYLAQLMSRYDTATALAAYNAGAGNAERWAREGTDPVARIRFPETRRYVERVLREYPVYVRLYPGEFDDE